MIFPTWWSSLQIYCHTYFPGFYWLKNKTKQKNTWHFSILLLLVHPLASTNTLGTHSNSRSEGGKVVRTDKEEKWHSLYISSLRQVSSPRKEKLALYNRDKGFLLARKFHWIWTISIVTLIYIHLTFPSEFSRFSVFPNQCHNFYRGDLVRLWFSPHCNSAINKIRCWVLFFFFFIANSSPAATRYKRLWEVLMDAPWASDLPWAKYLKPWAVVFFLYIF